MVLIQSAMLSMRDRTAVKAHIHLGKWTMLSHSRELTTFRVTRWGLTSKRLKEAITAQVQSFRPTGKQIVVQPTSFASMCWLVELIPRHFPRINLYRVLWNFGAGTLSILGKASRPCLSSSGDRLDLSRRPPLKLPTRSSTLR